MRECVEPWRCMACNSLMYNLGADGKPAEGAPSASYGNDEYKRVCSMCYGMLKVVEDSIYMSNCHKQYLDEQESKKRIVDRLKRNDL
jgi:hypothetical protein